MGPGAGRQEEGLLVLAELASDTSRLASDT